MFETNSMRKIKVGLVFSGGGAKGAYHLGVWKAIRELGLENIIKGVSGSSIGAITGYMFAVKEYDKSYQLWYSTYSKEQQVFLSSLAPISFFLHC